MIIEIRVCDLPLDTHTDADDADEAGTRQFSIDGRELEIDLCERHELEFVRMIDRYAQAAHPGRKPAQAPAQRRRTRQHRDHTAAVRAWAREQGRMVSESGRLPVQVVADYERAHA